MMARTLFSVVVSFLSVITVGGQGQQPPGARPASPGSGAITGQVVTEDGLPVANATVTVATINSRMPVRQSVATDDEGNFRVPDLGPGQYSVGAYLQGYVFQPRAGAGPGLYQPGESAKIVLAKGGVITGRVIDGRGEPVVGVPTRALLVRDQNGRRVPDVPVQQGWTDDRGIYRLFGLRAGTYVIATGDSRPQTQQLDPYTRDAPSFHPGAARAGAAEVSVRLGEEASGIDIQYRGARGRTISGTVVSARPSAAPNSGISLTLTDSATGGIVASSFVRPDDPERKFEFVGVDDGEYQLVARVGNYNEDGAASAMRRLSVKGADLSGVALTLIPLGSIAGRVVTADLPKTEVALGCPNRAALSFDETGVFAQMDLPAGTADQARSLTGSVSSRVTEKGEFTIRNLEAGRYRILGQTSTGTWYLSGVTAAGASGKPIDISRDGITLAPSERKAGLTVTFTAGAASLNGRVAPAVEGERVPARGYVNLIPAEPGRAEDPLRYAWGMVAPDGKFSVRGLAPGRYWIAFRAFSEKEVDDGFPRPQSWDAEWRAGLRREGEAAKLEIELQPCQRLNDYALRLSP